jgi:hypothetical protein
MVDNDTLVWEPEPPKDDEEPPPVVPVLPPPPAPKSEDAGPAAEVTVAESDAGRV